MQQLLANGLATSHLTSLELLSWPVVHDPHLEYILRWLPELRSVAAEHGPLCAREPWRLAANYVRVARIDVRPRRDSPLWVMSVNRVNWPEYQHMMSGYAHTLRFSPASEGAIDATTCPYPPPLVPPLELEIRYDKVPLDHSWGTPADRAAAAAPAAKVPSSAAAAELAAAISKASPRAVAVAALPAMQSDEPRIMTIGAFEGAWKWHGGVVANDGKVYCIPCSGTSVLAVDAARGTAETFGNVGGPQAYKWNRACVCTRTGKLYVMPSHHPSGAPACLERSIC